jgi:Protein of unknown function (DUF1353)
MPHKNGSFSGNPRTEWLDEPGADRRMRLLELFWYDDPAGRRWDAPAGGTVDGASIPPALWSTVGSPYTGDYRRASVVHDIACDRGIDRKEADKMFYFACLAGGCSKAQAELLYAGVRIGAWIPRVRLWENYTIETPVHREEATESLPEQSIQTTFREIAADIKSRPEDMPFEALEALVDRHLEAKARQ